MHLPLTPHMFNSIVPSAQSAWAALTSQAHLCSWNQANFRWIILSTSIHLADLTIYIPQKWSRSVVSKSATPWTVAYRAPLSVEFSRQEYWSGLPFPSLGDLPDPGIEPGSPTLQADALPSEPPGKPLIYPTQPQITKYNLNNNRISGKKF